jgi:hypothetical protein
MNYSLLERAYVVTAFQCWTALVSAFLRLSGFDSSPSLWMAAPY